MKMSDRRLRISDSLKISDFSNSLRLLQHPQQYAYATKTGAKHTSVEMTQEQAQRSPIDHRMKRERETCRNYIISPAK